MATGAAAGAGAGAAGGATGGLIGAAVGAVTGLTSYLFSRQSQKDALYKQRKQLEELRDTYLNNLDTQFTIQTAEANRNAAQSDKESDVDETTASTTFNNAIDQIGAQQEAEALAFNQSAIQIGQSTGSALASMAQSGTRSSSLAQAVDQQAALNSQQLQSQEDQARASDKANITSALVQLTNQRNTIQKNRTAADTLRNSYANGGDSYINYKQTRDYNEQQYNNSIEQVNDQIDDLSWNWGSFSNIMNNVFSIGSSMLGGATTGGKTGYKLGNLATYSGNSTDSNKESIWTKIGSLFGNS